MKFYQFKVLNIIFALSFILICCGEDNYNESSKKDFSINIVLCDLTASSINDNIDSVASRAAQIIYSVPQPARIVFLPIGEDIFTNPILSFDKIKKRPKKPSDRISFKEEFLKNVNTNAQRIQGRILAEYQRIEQELAEKDPARSCIANYIERANSFFLKEMRDTSNYNYTTRLFILSDMVEICNHSGLNMGQVRFTPNGEKVSKQAIETFQPNFSLSYLDEVYILAFTNTDFDRTKKLSSVVIKSFWESIFKKLEYKDAALISFEPMVPKFN